MRTGFCLWCGLMNPNKTWCHWHWLSPWSLSCFLDVKCWKLGCSSTLHSLALSAFRRACPGTESLLLSVLVSWGRYSYSPWDLSTLWSKLWSPLYCSNWAPVFGCLGVGWLPKDLLKESSLSSSNLSVFLSGVSPSISAVRASFGAAEDGLASLDAAGALFLPYISLTPDRTRPWVPLLLAIEVF